MQTAGITRKGINTPHSSKRSRLLVQTLEDRTVPNTYTVSNTQDGSPAPAGSLRAAIASANSNPGADSINFDAAVFGSAKVIDLTGAGQLSATGPVAITGPGSKLLTVKTSGTASATNRVLSISGGGATTVSGMTITGGNVTGTGGGINFGSESVTITDVVLTGNYAGSTGGGISFTTGTLTIANSVITSCASYSGGEVYCQSGKMTVTNVTISSNLSDYSTLSRGGGIYLFSGGQLTIADSTVANNTGGGLYVQSNGSLTMDRCTVSGNWSPRFYSYYYSGYSYGYGGGISVAGNGTITNSTISGNGTDKFSAFGGGVQVTSGSLTIRNSTIAFNSVSDGKGGGIGCATGAAIDLESTIVSDNQASGGPDASGSVTANFSLISNLAGATVTGGKNVTGSAKLLPLADNGGPTRTHALPPNSLAVDAGANPAGVATDQRGPGFPRSLGSGVDIGAVETDQTMPAAGAKAPDISAVTAAAETITVTYTVPTGVINASTFDDNDVTVTGPGGYSKAGHLIGGPYADASSVIVQYTVPPNDSGVASQWDYADNGAYTVTINANQVQSSSGTSVKAGQVGSFKIAVGTAFLVDEATDINDGNTSPGHVSLREALGLANLEPSLHDTISFSSSVFASLKTIAVGTAMSVAAPMVITGPAAGLVLDANGSGQRIFTIEVPGSSHNAVSISNMTLQNGSGVNGSMIRNEDEVLTLSKVNITGGKASSAVVLHDGAWLLATDCVLSGNHGGNAILGGAGYYSSNFVSLTRCRLSGNGASSIAGGAISIGYGGLSASYSTFSNNTSAAGGAICGGSIALVNCTLSGNTATGDGGAVWTRDAVEVDNSTVTGNTAGGKGGGIGQINPSIIPTAGAITLNSSIVAGNSAADGPDLWTNYSPSTTGGDYNLVGANPTTLALGGSHNKIGTAASPLNPMLAPLANNGGPTQTHALLPGSPALNAGSNPLGLAADQRGAQRIAGDQADIGAYESGATPVPPPTVSDVVINGGEAQRSRVTSVTIDFDQLVTLPANPADAFQLKRQADSALVALTVNVTNDYATHVTLTFTGALSQFGSLDDGRYTVTVFASKVSNAIGQLDGDNNGIGGDDFVLTSTGTTGVFRLFGDSDGNGTVNSADFAAFRIAFGLGASTFDFNDDSQTNSNDFGEFRKRFGIALGP
jgi:parallel beta-helix repeat protein